MPAVSIADHLSGRMHCTSLRDIVDVTNIPLAM